eukprot:3892844-Amphidinium_carterae.1
MDYEGPTAPKKRQMGRNGSSSVTTIFERLLLAMVPSSPHAVLVHHVHFVCSEAILDTREASRLMEQFRADSKVSFLESQNDSASRAASFGGFLDL